MQLEDLIPTISSATAASSNPFSFESTLALPYPVSPFPSYLDLSDSNALTTSSNISNDFNYNPLLDLSYSTALFAMYTSLPPLMPWPNSLVGTGAATGASRGLIHRRKNGKNKVQKAGFQLRAMMIREAMNDLSEIEGSEQWATSRLDEVVDYCERLLLLRSSSLQLADRSLVDTDVDDEWLCSFPPAERELVKEHLFNSIQSHPSSQAACLAVATVLQLRLLPPEDVEEKRRIIEQGKRHFELAMEKMVGAPLETQIVVLMDSMLHQVRSVSAVPFYRTRLTWRGFCRPSTLALQQATPSSPSSIPSSLHTPPSPTSTQTARVVAHVPSSQAASGNSTSFFAVSRAWTPFALFLSETAGPSSTSPPSPVRQAKKRVQ